MDLFKFLIHYGNQHGFSETMKFSISEYAQWLGSDLSFNDIMNHGIVLQSIHVNYGHDDGNDFFEYGGFSLITEFSVSMDDDLIIINLLPDFLDFIKRIKA